MTKKLILGLTAVMVLMACDSGTEPALELPGEPVCIEEIDSTGEDYLGLDEAQALELAAEQGLSPREVGRDGECFAITMDLRQDRINLEYVDDVVVGAAVF